jgi:hypothetical protein
MFLKLAVRPSSGKKGKSGGSYSVKSLGATPYPPFLPEDGSRASFRNVDFKEIKHWTMDKVQKQDSSKCITPSSEPFRVDLKLIISKYHQ